MSLLIDGYNLLHAAGVIAGGSGPSSLARSRRALLDYLAAAVGTDELAKTTVVFDAKNAPPGLPREMLYRGITVRFAPSHSEADDLIEELIRADTSPRKLTVVSSDHRLHRAARRRRATAVDSDVWCSTIRSQRAIRIQPIAVEEVKPGRPLTSDEVQDWLAEFGDIEESTAESSRRRSTEDEGATSTDSSRSPLSASHLQATEKDNIDIVDPFPPGYAEDLLDNYEL